MGSIQVQPGRVELRIGDPIPTAGMTPHDRSRLNEMLRQKIAELLEDAVPAGRA
jgi:hypothetical protein